ncbi:hypothetical protein GCM10009037_13620 [Halarchaeum grantii]|uniref:SnoaL-like domain-containing protein n=1 Tax=Halarchaeum grantii TaxID=1193105 RepID=A0A830F930_9EURY|nr:nuclear transport factor 2 family protein [Halarchaeum grantii]GGL31162.1 hypothetical protein GCM10009037_13620 [Halarchaeum grantii]
MVGNADPEAARRYYELVDDEDYDGLVGLFSPDVVYERPGQPPIEGLSELRAFYETGRPLSEGEHTVHTVVAEGDTVAVRGSFEGVQDGERVAFGFADFHEFDDEGFIIHRHTYTDRDTV